MTTGLTRSAEDYLLAIYRLHREQQSARVKDVAAAMGVRKPSVVTQVARLKEEGLVTQSPYGRIELTSVGLGIARTLYRKNRVVFSYLTEVLGVDPGTAEIDACGIEHELHRETYQRFVRFMESHSRGTAAALEADEDDGVEACLSTLNDMDVGFCGEILRIVGDERVRSRLLEMGLVPGERVRLANIAPLGDPLDVYVKGFHLSLRREEADSVALCEDSIHRAGKEGHCQVGDNGEGGHDTGVAGRRRRWHGRRP